MKILYAAHFDCCGVGVRQRRYLRDLGVDFRMAVERVYWPEGLEAEWWLEHPEGIGEQEREIQEFAAECDLVIQCPAIHQYWSSDEGERPRVPAEDTFPVPLKARRTAYLFHGSVNLAENLDEYRRLYQGETRLATTLDYVASMDAEYLPSIVETTRMEAAPLREGALSVVHAPSDPRVCQTEAFLSICHDLGVTVETVRGVSHEECLRRKAQHPAGFDHVRGAFSINSLENAGLGLVNLVGVSAQARRWLREHYDTELPWPAIESMDDVADELARLKESVGYTREQQQKARQWSSEDWSPERTAMRVLDVYASLR